MLTNFNFIIHLGSRQTTRWEKNGSFSYAVKNLPQQRGQSSALSILKMTALSKDWTEKSYLGKFKLKFYYSMKTIQLGATDSCHPLGQCVPLTVSKSGLFSGKSGPEISFQWDGLKLGLFRKSENKSKNLASKTQKLKKTLNAFISAPGLARAILSVFSDHDAIYTRGELANPFGISY